MDKEEGVVKIRRAEIDTRAPFRSVKEAVMLFGERVLAGEVYANKLKEIRARANENSHGPSKLGVVTAELEETKQNLHKAREEGMLMANCLSSLKEELEKTKRELRQMKERETEKPMIDSEIEDLKFVENATSIQDKKQTDSAEAMEFQKKRYVKFASPPSLAQVIISPEGPEVLETHPSLKKKKKKPLIPLIGGIFSKKKGIQEVASPRSRGP
ncbi:hypothetical protein HHK36_002984 [Tetracentron sinense]|uniref:WEB family protein n=1 Tax=Tetracentron sinense TaxID=13715 RepID=A0A834ZRY7_TETSI|nr:hypothetical protein HHK36_002984 [Tetracentron sinense]